MKRILHIVGARPNFMKAAPVMRALASLSGEKNITQQLIHTGQHYAANMSDVFFQQLGLPAPDINLEVGSASHARQTAEIMVRLEERFLRERPDWVLVYGDVNSTVAAALVCAKMLIPFAHVEAGLRSGDRTMPEEVNRLVTDQLADLLFTPSLDGDENLAREGVAPQKIHFVGNVMIDTLVRLLPEAEIVWTQLANALELSSSENGVRRYALATLHRPSNVDDADGLRRTVAALEEIAAQIPIIFPVHPRTRTRLVELNFNFNSLQLRLVEPLGYIEFLALQRHAQFVITDSGGIQEETTFLGVPCLTVRENTERPVTVEVGTNTLIGTDMSRLCIEAARIIGGEAKRGRIPDLWDGKAAERIAAIIAEACA
ncbi:MAG: UDP-N-acetylglucosamine 2-epimerase (non-hydrolyzing) [Pyrinomonadaceae bacterium]